MNLTQTQFDALAGAYLRAGRVLDEIENTAPQHAILQLSSAVGCLGELLNKEMNFHANGSLCDSKLNAIGMKMEKPKRIVHAVSLKKVATFGRGKSFNDSSLVDNKRRRPDLSKAL